MITKVADGVDIVYSFLIENQNLDGLDGSNDSYVFGVGDKELNSQVTKKDGDFIFTPMRVSHCLAKKVNL